MDRSEFVRLFCERPQAFAWFLGAGASRNANLPTAEDIITDLKRRYYCSEENQTYSTKDMQNDGVRNVVEAYMESRGFPHRGAPDEYTEYFERIFGEDRERQRKYIKAMLAEERVRLSVGSRVLGALIASGLIRVVYTTNFDTVIEKAVAEVSGKSLAAFHLEGVRGVNAAINNEEYPVYCKLHGDFRYDSIKNLAPDLIEQNQELANSFGNAASRFGLVVAGYSGRDESVMTLLNTVLSRPNPFPHGVFWMIMKGANTPEPVSQFLSAARARGVSAQLVEVESFDTQLLRIWRNLPDRHKELDGKVRKGRQQAVAIEMPSPDGTAPIVRYNALPIAHLPDQCLRIELKTRATWDIVKSKLRSQPNCLTATIDDGLLAWGSEEEARALFGDELTEITPARFDPNWRTGERLQIKRFLEDGIARAFATSRPLIMRRQGAGNALIVDSKADDIGVFDPLHEVVGKTTGHIPGLSIPKSFDHEAVTRVNFAESVRISLAWADGRVWLLLRPDIWIWPVVARRHAAKWLEARRSDRRNKKYDALLSAWITVLTDGAGRAQDVQILAYEGPTGPGNPFFKLSTRTAYSKKRGSR